MKKEETPLKRRQFIGNITKAGILGTLAASPAAGFAQVSNRAKAEAADLQFLSLPYLQAPTPDSMTIMWITSERCYSWVEYGEAGGLDQKAHSSTFGLVDAYNRVNKIQLKDLKPNTTYSYRVLSKKIEDFQPYKLTYGTVVESPVSTFTTPNPGAKSVSWLVMNDIHDRPQSIPFLMNLNGKDPYDFVFLNGDMFDYQNDEQQIIEHLLTPCTETFAGSTPFLFVRGNHETRGKFARELHHYFQNPGNGYYFSFEHGPVYNIVLDTGEDKPDTHDVYAGIVDFDAYREEQAIWLKKEIEKPAFKKAGFRVVMMHIPHFHSDDWHGTLHCRKLFAPLFEQGKIDMFIAGHTHRYGFYKPVEGQHSYPIFIGGGPREGQRTLIKVKADEQVLNVQMLNDKGEEVGACTVKSKK